ncbi:MAG: ATP-binding cassette domain-containing protein [archaeon]|nr:ATP-binding cassette domain-containing protein [archaeon]
MDGLIETKDLVYFYDGTKTPSLDSINIKITPGKKTVILGANGAGKSTLFYHFNAIAKPHSGVVLFEGEPLKYRKKALLGLRSKVAVVLQNPDDQVFESTVEDDIAYGPTNLDLPQDEVKRRVEDALFQTGLTEFRKKNTLQLSYGQRKRLALAGDLSMKPEVLIMDEPTAGLDPQMALDLMELAEQLHFNGVNIVLSTHDVDLAYAWADEIHVLRKGKLIYSGPSEGFYSDPVQVHMTGVMPPSMFTVNKNLAHMKEIPEAPYPRTETQLISKMVEVKKGSLHIIPLSEDIVSKVTDSTDISVGVFGTASRGLLVENRMKVDYLFNGFESCISDCMNGRESILVCDTDCVDLIKNKIVELKRFGTDIEYDVRS